MAVRRETSPEFVNRIVNSDGVRPFIRPDGGFMDWSEIVSRPSTQTGVIVLSNGEDAVAAFEMTAPGVFQSHTLFSETCRGKKAVETGREMVAWMFDHGADIVWGSTPRNNLKAIIFNSAIGAERLPTTDDEDVIYEIRKDRWH